MKTFPEYITKDSGAHGDATKDVLLFADVVCLYLNISKRFLGDEQSCQVTRACNMGIQKVLPRYGIEVVVFPRKKNGNEVNSASRIRESLKNGEKERLLEYVPDTAYHYLQMIMRQEREIGEL